MSVPCGIASGWTHLADTACLTEGTDCTHVALVSGAILWRVEVGCWVQRHAGVRAHISRCLQVVTRAKWREQPNTNVAKE